LDAESAGDVKAGVELEETSVEADGETVTVESTALASERVEGVGSAAVLGALESLSPRNTASRSAIASTPACQTSAS